MLGALAERLHAIKAGDANWHDFHQTGVLLSELAESLWLLYKHKRADDYRRTLESALQYFGRARQLVEANLTGHDNTLARAQINCDNMRAAYRLNRLVANTVYSVEDMVHGGLHSVIADLQKLENEAPEALKARVRHQQGIAHTFAFEMCDCQIRHYDEAFILLTEEGNADDQQVFRTLHFIAALRAATQGTMMQCRVHADMALVSARQNKDRQHEVRALLIRGFGVLGEKLCRAMRDGSAMLYL